MKKIVSLLLVMCLVSLNICAYADENSDDSSVSVTINGEIIEFDVPAQIIDDRTMVPMRKIFESLGSTVNWFDEYKIIVATKGSKIISMKINSNVLLIQDILSDASEIIDLDVAPQIVNDRTLVPIRAVAESLDANVNWNDENRTVEITN